MELAPNRILMTADTVGGVWTYSLELARALRARGVSVALATMGRRLDADQRRSVEEVPGVTLFESEFKLEWMQNPWQDVAAAGEWLLEIAESWRPDLVHVNGYAHANLRWRRPVVLVAHSCVASWWKAVFEATLPDEWNHYRAAVKAGVKAADAIVAPSRVMLESVRLHYGPVHHGRVIHNGLPNPVTLPRVPPRPGLPLERGLLKEPFIFSAGRLWDEGKNISALTGIAGDLAWPVFVAGEAGLEGSSQKNLNGVRPLGKLPSDQVRQWMNRATVYCLPARYEPFGLSILEAAQSGCALVLGDIPSLCEIWGDAALFVHPSDTGALKHILNELASDPARVRDLAARALHAAQKFSAEEMAREYLVVYAEAAVACSLRINPGLLSLAQPNGPVPIRKEGASCGS
jgi:glycogen synthase